MNVFPFRERFTCTSHAPHMYLTCGAVSLNLVIPLADGKLRNDSHKCRLNSSLCWLLIVFFHFISYYPFFLVVWIGKRRRTFRRKKDFKSQLFFLFFSNGSAEKKQVEAAWLQIATKATMLRTRDDGLLAQTGWTTEILRVCFISSILRHNLSWLSSPNVGIDRQKISRRDAE